MSFRELLDMLLGMVSHKGNDNMEARARIWLNRAHLKLLTKGRVTTESSRYQTSPIASQTLITDVPIDFLSLVNYRILDKNGDTSARTLLEEKSAEEIDEIYPNKAAEPTGRPLYISVRRAQYPAETGNATTLTIRSTSTADTGIKVSVVGYPGSTRARTIHQEVTLNGTTNVSIPTAITTLIGFSKAKDTVGFIQLRDGSSNVLAELMPWERSGQRIVLEAFPYWDDTYLTEMTYNRRPPPMLNDSDVPFYLAPEFHLAIVECAATFAMGFMDDERIAVAAQVASDAERELLLMRRSTETRRGGFKWGSKGRVRRQKFYHVGPWA